MGKGKESVEVNQVPNPADMNYLISRIIRVRLGGNIELLA